MEHVGVEEKIIYQSAQFHVGSFRCPTNSPIWNEQNQSGNTPMFVFPRVPVLIQHVGADAVLATPNEVMLYNPLQLYNRQAVNPGGDRCEYIGIQPKLLSDSFRSMGLPQTDANSNYESPNEFAPFNRSFIACRPEVFFMQRVLYALASRSDAVCQLEFDETLMALLQLMIVGFSRSQCTGDRSSRQISKARDLVRGAQAIMATSFLQPISLELIASRLDCSVFHLCRVFKMETGTSIHATIRQLRLLSSLEQVQDSDTSLTRIALDHQFSSHSHFTSAFRSMFGVTPLQLRGKNSGKLKKIIQDFANDHR